MSFWKPGVNGVTLTVKVHPRSKRPGIQTDQGTRLKIAVSEPADDGKANAAVRAALAKLLHCPTSAVTIIAGAANREKVLRIDGDTNALITRLASL
jgi:uncharacterized protein (TIGR00251 family)